MDTKKVIAGFATAAALITGGAVTDAQINPYSDKIDRLEIAAESTIEAAGENKIELIKDRPEVVLSKWNDELRMGVRYDKVEAEGSRALFTDRMEWKAADGKEEVHAYPLPAGEGMEDGGFEVALILNERPDTDTFCWTLEGWEDLEFYKQPPLTVEEIAEGAFRPDNVVNSYAVYHRVKVNHEVGKTNYATGKAYHRYRPQATDDDGNTVWGDSNFSEGQMCDTFPTEWLDNAKYPVKI